MEKLSRISLEKENLHVGNKEQQAKQSSVK